ncbi:MAG: rod shape-determining protein RodA [Spirochaetaceae bacterium]
MTHRGNNEEGKQSSLLRFDLVTFFAMILLMGMGVLFIYSSNVISSGASLRAQEHVYQIVWIIGALAVYFLLQLGEYDKYEGYSYYLYFFVVLLLAATLQWGSVVNASRSWLGFFNLGIQPSEFMKIAFIMVLSSFYQRRASRIENLSTFLMGILFLALPVFLILLQPDLGTSLVFFPVFLGVSFIAGVRKRYVFFVFISGFLLVLFTVLPVWEATIAEGRVNVFAVFREKTLFLFTMGILFLSAVLGIVGYFTTKRSLFYWISYGFSALGCAFGGSYIFRGALMEYQIMRLIVFLKPEVDPQGSGWNIIQSLTAVGSGGLSGKGFLQSTQSHYQYLPESSTDFIFSIIAEEWGFLGSFAVLALFGIILVRGVYILLNARDSYGVLIGTGILTMLFFHMVVNIGMTIGLMPITGIPLMFLSYGGSSLWTAVIGMAFLQNIYINRYAY